MTALDILNTLSDIPNATLRDALCLMHIAASGAGIRQKDIATALDTPPPSITRIIDKLESNGLVRRKDHPTDRRSILLIATAGGRALAARVS